MKGTVIWFASQTCFFANLHFREVCQSLLLKYLFYREYKVIGSTVLFEDPCILIRIAVQVLNFWDVA